MYTKKSPIHRRIYCRPKKRRHRYLDLKMFNQSFPSCLHIKYILRFFFVVVAFPTEKSKTQTKQRRRKRNILSKRWMRIESKIECAVQWMREFVQMKEKERNRYRHKIGSEYFLFCLRSIFIFSFFRISSFAIFIDVVNKNRLPKKRRWRNK